MGGRHDSNQIMAAAHCVVTPEDSALVIVAVELRPTALVVAKEVPVVIRLGVVLVHGARATLKDKGNDQEQHDTAKHQRNNALARAKKPSEELDDCIHV